MTTIHYSQTGKTIIVPDPLRAGDAVGVIAASGPTDQTSLNRGSALLEGMGLRPVLGRHALQRDDYLAGIDEQRLSDLNTMIRDPQIHGIMFARGGYGVMRLLESVDYGAAAQDPKLLLGMSDITALQLSLFSQCGLATLSGPMVATQMAAELDSLSKEWLIRGLTESLEDRELLPASWPALRVLRHGHVYGPLLGGCLALVTALLGTPYCPDFNAAILLLEDVNEPLYRIDRMLTHLKLAGALGRISAVVLGYFQGAEGEDLREAAEHLVLEMTADHPVPVVSGYPHGHALPNLTIPHGVPVELDTEVPSMRMRLDKAGSAWSSR